MDASRPFARRLLLLCLSVILPAVLTGVASAAWISLGGGEGSTVEVQVLESSADRIVLDYTIPGFYADPVVIEGKTYYSISLPGESRLLEKGLPELPRINRSVIIPDKARMAVRLLEAQVTDLAAYPVTPSKGDLPRTIDPATVPYSFGAVYQQEAFWPEETERGGEPYVLRDYRGMVIEIVPFQAQGPSRALRAASHIRVEVVAEGLDTRNTIDRSSQPDHLVFEFADIYGRHFLNWGLTRYTPVIERGRMLVITYDAFHDAMVPFVEWKNQMGMPTRMVDISTIGNTAAQIDAYIDNVYNTEGLAFVLLVGDGAQIATQHSGGGASDPTYAKVVGTDNYPEILVGRFSAENVSQVQTQVARTIAYEKTPAAGAAWYHLGTGIASDQGPGDDGEYDYQHMNIIRTKLLGFTYTAVDQIYDPSASAAMVSSALNAGRSIVDYTGHGSATSWGTTGFSNSNVSSLTNDNMLPFIFSVACQNGNFESMTCFAEAWMRSTHNGNPIGAIATYMSSIDQSWNPPMCGQDAAIDLLVQKQKQSFGGLAYNGSCQMMDEYGSGGQSMFLTWHIFGDPSLLVRTDTPRAMTAQHDGSFFIGATDYAVTVPAVEGALCALYGGGILYGSAYTDAGGMATIHMDTPPTGPMALTLTVTGFNRIPVIENVEVLPMAGPYIAFSGSSVLDAVGGDGDSLCDAGEAVGLVLALRNSGIEPADPVSATIATSDPYVQIVDSSADFGTIEPDSIVSNLEPYAIEISSEAPDQHVASFSVAIHAPQGDWSGGFSLTLGAPILSAGSALIDDSAPWGNGTGSADPGDSCYVQFRIGNAGHGTARDLSGTLTCSDPNVEILDADGECLIAPAGGEGLLSSFLVHVLPSCPSQTTLVFHASLTSPSGIGAELDFSIMVGAWADDVETDKGWTLGLPTDTASSGDWVRVDPIGTTATAGGQAQPEDDHTAAPGVICFVTGQGTVGGGPGDADVDGGTTTLLTPVFNLAGAVSATVDYWRWYTNNLGNNPSSDWWRVQVTDDGVNWVALEETSASANEWRSRQYNLQDYVNLTDHVQIRFIAEDAGSGSLVEAAVDDFSLSVVRAPVTEVSDESPASRGGFVGLRPNPIRDEGVIAYRVARDQNVRVGLYDVAGRTVRMLTDGPASAGDHAIRFDAREIPAGVYFLRFDSQDLLQVKQVAIVR